MGWSSPKVLTELAVGVVVLAIFAVIETKVPDPMFHLKLFRIRAFSAGNVASLLSSLGRGGLMFILIIWLQGIWLPEHGYSFAQTPLWAGIFMLPLTVGFLISGPVSGILSDRYGARPFATGGVVAAALSFGLSELLPVDFSYVGFAALLLLSGLAMGLFAAPDRAGIMSSLPPDQRGAGAGMVSTFQNAAMVLSIGIYFSLVVIGLTATLSRSLLVRLTSHGMPRATAEHAAHLPPVSVLFAAFLGYNPVRSLLAPSGVLAKLPHADARPSARGSTTPIVEAPRLPPLAFAGSVVGAAPPAGNGAAAHSAAPTPEELVGELAPWRQGALAERLGLVVLDRANPGAAAAALAIPLEEALSHDERTSYGIVRALAKMNQATSLYGVQLLDAGDAGGDEKLLWQATELVSWQVAATTGEVVLGRASTIVLAEYPNTLRVRRDGPLEARIARAMAHDHLDEATVCRLQRESDRARDAYARHLYGAEMTDPSHFHLLIDTTAIDIDACVTYSQPGPGARRPVGTSHPTSPG